MIRPSTTSIFDFSIRKMNNRCPQDIIDTEGLFEFQQHNGDNSLKGPLYKYAQFGKNEHNVRYKQPIVDTIEDQTRIKIANNGAVDWQNLTGGNSAFARTLPGASSRCFDVGGKKMDECSVGNNLSLFSNDKPLPPRPPLNCGDRKRPKGVPQRDHAERFGTDRPVEWSSAPTANNFQGGSAGVQQGVPDFATSKESAVQAYRRDPLKEWKEDMGQILKDYGNSLAKACTFGTWKPKEPREKFCGGMRPAPSPAYGTTLSTITIVLVVVLLFFAVIKCVECAKTSQRGYARSRTEANDFD